MHWEHLESTYRHAPSVWGRGYGSYAGSSCPHVRDNIEIRPYDESRAGGTVLRFDEHHGDEDFVVFVFRCSLCDGDVVFLYAPCQKAIEEFGREAKHRDVSYDGLVVCEERPVFRSCFEDIRPFSYVGFVFGLISCESHVQVDETR